MTSSAWLNNGAGFAWLKAAEIEKVIEAAKAGEDPRRDMILLANCLYLGMDGKAAVNVRYCSACGDAIENRTRGAFLHIPNEYRRIIAEAARSSAPFQLKDRLTDTEPEAAESVIASVFARAGLDTVNGIERLRRTAARLHYVNQWTREEEIARYFPEVAEAAPPENGVLYYRTQTDAEEQAQADKGMQSLPPELAGIKRG